MKLLALRLCEHDSNFSYFDGKELHYFKSERTSQVKHHAFDNLWEWREVVKKIWNLDYNTIDEIAVVLDPWRHNFPTDFNIFPAIEYDLFPARCKVWKVHHHYAHSLSSWVVDLREPAVSFIIDGYGDQDQSWTVIKNNNIIAQGSLNLHGSIGTEMAEMGRLLGIDAEHGIDLAGKVMGLQSYGNIDNEFLKKIHNFSIYEIKKIFDISLWYTHKENKTLGKLTILDWAKTVHYQIGELLVLFFKKYANPNDVISYSGGVAQNVIWNTRIKEEFKNIIIPPHCNDEGLSLGAIEWLRIRNNLPKFLLKDFPFCQYDKSPVDVPTEETIKFVAGQLAEGKIVAWYQGHGEIGPRALGHRSILMNPMIINGKEKINKIKNRENYRPFGASVLAEYKEEYFDLQYDNPYMLFVGKSKKDLNCITHVDGTSRVQTVSIDSPFKKLLKNFYDITGCPVLLNTSLNLAGKPIAGYPEDAIDFFQNTDIDVLVIGNSIYQK